MCVSITKAVFAAINYMSRTVISPGLSLGMIDACVIEAFVSVKMLS